MKNWLWSWGQKEVRIVNHVDTQQKIIPCRERSRSKDSEVGVFQLETWWVWKINYNTYIRPMITRTHIIYMYSYIYNGPFCTLAWPRRFFRNWVLLKSPAMVIPNHLPVSEWTMVLYLCGFANFIFFVEGSFLIFLGNLYSSFNPQLKDYLLLENFADSFPQVELMSHAPPFWCHSILVPCSSWLMP